MGDGGEDGHGVVFVGQGSGAVRTVSGLSDGWVGERLGIVMPLRFEE